MQVIQKFPQLQAANDPPRRIMPRRVSVVVLPPEPKPVWQFIVGGFLLLSLGLMAWTLWLTQQTVTPAPVNLPLLRVQSLEPWPADALPPPAQPIPVLPTPVKQTYSVPVSQPSAPEPPLSSPKEVARAPIGTIPLPPREQELPAQPTEIILPTSNAETLEEEATNIAASKIAEAHADIPVQMSPAEEQNSHDLLTRAHAALAAGDYPDAVEFYDQVLVTQSRNHDALAGMAYALAENGETDKAIKATYRLLKTYPHDDEAEANLAHLLMQEGKDEDAIPSMDRAVRDAPRRLSYLLDLATLYDRCGHTAAALTAYRHLVEKAGQKDAASLPLSTIRLRVLYLERFEAKDGDPSKTSPVEGR
jgi:Flp pilus assembly protein TadD